MKGAKFANINLGGLNFTDTDMTGAELYNTQFRNTNLTEVNLTSVKGLNVDDLVSASSIRDIKINIELLKEMDDQSLEKLITKLVEDYKTFINGSDIDGLIAKLEEIINDQSHPLKFSNKVLNPDYVTTEDYLSIIYYGKLRLLELLKLKYENQDQPLNAEVQNKLKVIFETNAIADEATSLKSKFVQPGAGAFFGSSFNKKSLTDEFHEIIKQKASSPVHTQTTKHRGQVPK